MAAILEQEEIDSLIAEVDKYTSFIDIEDEEEDKISLDSYDSSPIYFLKGSCKNFSVGRKRDSLKEYLYLIVKFDTIYKTIKLPYKKGLEYKYFNARRWRNGMVYVWFYPKCKAFDQKVKS